MSKDTNHVCECQDTASYSIHGKCHKCKGLCPIVHNPEPQLPKVSNRPRAVRRQFAKVHK